MAKGIDLLKKAAKPAAAAKKSDERVSVELKGKQGESLRSWVPAKLLSDQFESQVKQLGSEVKDASFEIWADMLWKQKNQPQNPRLFVNNANGKCDCEAVFTAQERYQVNVPDVPEDKSVEEAFVDLLLDASGEEWREKATKLVEDELKFIPDVSLPLTKMLVGEKSGKAFIQPSEAQVSAATKLLSWFNEGGQLEFTEAEREAMANSQAVKFSTTVMPGFLNRITTYCASRKQLETVLRFITPILSLRSPKFAVSDPMEARNQRMIDEAAKILGTSLGDDEEEAE
jgi:hypothetical protein